MPNTITAAQRDALCDLILDHLSGVCDIETAMKQENFETAHRLCREFSDDLRLLSDDLGFGPAQGAPIELTSPPDVLQRALPRLRYMAESVAASQEPAWAEAEAMKERSRHAGEACESVLASLKESGSNGS